MEKLGLARHVFITAKRKKRMIKNYAGKLYKNKKPKR